MLQPLTLLRGTGYERMLRIACQMYTESVGPLRATAKEAAVSWDGPAPFQSVSAGVSIYPVYPR